MKTYTITYWTNETETVEANSITEAYESVYDCYPDGGSYLVLLDGSGYVHNEFGDECATIREA